MCTIAILLDVVAGAPLVVAANRDEMYARPTLPPASLGDGIVGGRDVLSGGTWLAVRRDGRFAAVTNQRLIAPPPGLRSRGLAVMELAAAPDPDRYVAAIDPTAYASMNLVWGDARGARVAYARQEGALEILRLPPGIHVLCNDRLDAPGFPRAARFAEAIARAPRTWPALLPAVTTALADHTEVEPAPSHLPPDLARAVTATCIHTPQYGTRSATVFAADADGAVAYLHAEGPPCTARLVDRRELL